MRVFVSDEELRDLIVRFSKGRHPKVNAALEELVDLRRRRFIIPSTTYEINLSVPESEIRNDSELLPLSRGQEATVKVHDKTRGETRVLTAKGDISIEVRPYEGP